MNKQTAANYLRISVRTLETLMAKNAVPHSTIKGKTRPLVDFSQGDLDNLAKSAGYLVNPAILDIEAEEVRETNPATLATIPAEIPANLANNPAGNFAENPAQIVMSEEQFRELLQSREVSLAEKPLLTLSEAARFSGISEYRLRQAIRDEELAARRLGRSDRVRRSDLCAWIDRQF